MVALFHSIVTNAPRVKQAIIISDDFLFQLESIVQEEGYRLRSAFHSDIEPLIGFDTTNTHFLPIRSPVSIANKELQASVFNAENPAIRTTSWRFGHDDISISRNRFRVNTGFDYKITKLNVLAFSKRKSGLSVEIS